MSVRYAAVKWNRNKRCYDAILVLGIAAFLAVVFVVGHYLHPGIRAEVLALRALGTCGFVLLHVILCIGPLARFDPRLLPVLYNRRHLGVATFLVGLAHAALATGYYHGFGIASPLVSLIASNTEYGSLAAFPFEALGLIALAILFVMAATSHDFWLRNLSPGVWKALHMLVYVAYALLVMHVALGALQAERHAVYVGLLVTGVATVASLHLLAAFRERQRDMVAPGALADDDSWVDAGDAASIPDLRASIVCLPGGDRVAIFRHGNQISAVTNVCAHQRGPLGEGKIVDGCITCPWHGWEYRPGDGCSPPPFAEKIATYRVRLLNGRVLVNKRPLPPGTATEPAQLEAPTDDSSRLSLCIRKAP